MGYRIRKFLNFTLDDDLGELSHAEWVVYWSIVLTPLWWLLGIQTLLFMLIPVYLLIRGFDLDRIFNQKLPIAIWGWLVVCMVTFSLAMISLANLGLPSGKIVSTMVTFTKGYFLIFSCLMLPFWHRIRMKVISRAVCWVAFSYLITLAIQVVCLLGNLWKEPIVPPLAKIIPGDKMSLLVKPAVWQKFFGILLPRTCLYTADPPIPAICGLLFYFICRGEENDRLRQMGVTGCVVALIVSQSRLAWVCFPLTVLTSAFFQHFFARQLSLWGMTGISTWSAILGITVKEMLSKPMEVFNSARAESSADRARVVGATLKAWQEYPWFGWGVPQGSVKWYIYDIELGSFSTYAAMLYLQGYFGFGFFLFALCSTLVTCAVAGMNGSVPGARAVGALLGLYFLMESLPITWVAVYFWVFFVWIGAIFLDNMDSRATVPQWRHFST
jgi:O-Antigen ligase